MMTVLAVVVPLAGPVLAVVGWVALAVAACLDANIVGSVSGANNTIDAVSAIQAKYADLPDELDEDTATPPFPPKPARRRVNVTEEASNA